MLTHKSQRFNNSHQCNIQKKKEKKRKKRNKTSSLRQSDAYLICGLDTNLYLDVVDLSLQFELVVPGF